MGRWAGRGKGNRVEPQERGTPLPCTARLTTSPHRGLAPLPAQQEMLSDPEPLVETPCPAHPWASREGASQTPKESSVQVRVWLQTQPSSTTRTPFCPC